MRLIKKLIQSFFFYFQKFYKFIIFFRLILFRLDYSFSSFFVFLNYEKIVFLFGKLRKLEENIEKKKKIKHL